MKNENDWSFFDTVGIAMRKAAQLAYDVRAFAEECEEQRSFAGIEHDALLYRRMIDSLGRAERAHEKAVEEMKRIQSEEGE